jgi:hypothetical protein
VTMPTPDTVITRPRSAIVWWIVAILALLLYLGLALYQLDLPGLNYDEALDAAPAVQTVLGQPIDSAYTIALGSRTWPLMVSQYVGPTTTYLLVAAFRIFGISAISVRATGVLIGLISLLLSWGFLKEYLDERVAGLSILLLAASPGFVFWSRMIAWVHFPLLPIAIATIWLLFRWYSRRRGRYLVLAAFGLGFGLQTHIMFLLVWGGLGLAWLLLSPWLGSGRGWRRWLWPWQITGMRVWALGALALIIGASPMLIYNLPAGGTIRYAGGRLASGESAKFRSWQDLVAAIPVSLRSLGALLSGGWFAHRIGALHQNLLALPAFGLALALITWLAVRRRLSYSPARVAFCAILVLSMVLLRTLIEGADGIHHLLVVWPLPQVLFAVSVLSLTDSTVRDLTLSSSVLSKRRALGLGALGLIAACLIGAEAWTTLASHRSLAQTHGVGFFSDAIYTLAQDLEQSGAPQPIAMDWGFRRNLQVLTQNRVDPPEWFTYSRPPGPEFEGYVADLISRYPDALYLFHVPEYTAFQGHWELFEEAAYRHHRSPVLWKTYYQRNGQPIFQVYTLKTTPRLLEPPAIEHPLDARLGDQLALLGYDMPKNHVHPGEAVELTLYWKATAPQARNLKVFAHLLDDGGRLWGQHDDRPIYGSYPMTEWQPGEIVPDRIRIELGADVPPGTYHVFAGMYDQSTGERVPLSLDGQRLKGDTLGLTEVTVEAPPSGSG